MTSIGLLTYEHFAPLVEEAFEVRTDGVTSALVLAEATTRAEAGGTGPEGQTRTPFSLVFWGPAEPLLPQGTHLLVHPELGRLDVFLVPIGPQSEGMGYEAVFG